MKKCYFFLLIIFTLLFGGCIIATTETRTLDLHTVSSWQHEENKNISPAVAATIDGRDYLFVGIQPNSSRDDTLLTVLDVTDPTSPIEVASMVAPESSPIYGIVMHGTTLYARLMRSFWIVDVSDPSSPKQLSILNTGSNPANIFLVGNYLYIDVSDSGDDPRMDIQVIDVTDPSNPQLAATVAVAPMANIRAASDNRLYCTGEDGFRIMDISSPLEPYEIGFFADPTGIEGHSTTGSDWDTLDVFFDVAVVDSYVFIASAQSGLRVLDITDPSNIKEVAKLDTEVITLSISIYDNLAFLSGAIQEPFHFEMLVIDITEPTNPKILDSVEIPILAIERPIKLDDYIYVTGSPSLEIIGLYKE